MKRYLIQVTGMVTLGPGSTNERLSERPRRTGSSTTSVNSAITGT